jgi:TonB family protein
MKGAVALLTVGVLGLPPLSSRALCGEPDRPVIHNRVAAQTSALDRLVLTTYEKKYRIVPISEQDTEYVAPVPVEGEMPHFLPDEAGRPIRGYVLALYLIMLDGSVKDPVILKSTDARLNAAVVEALRKARFKPAAWRGETVATVAGQEVVFAEQRK